MKVNRFGRAEILTGEQIDLLFTEGLTRPKDRALFWVCLYAAARINEVCTLLSGDVIGIKGVLSNVDYLDSKRTLLTPSNYKRLSPLKSTPKLS